MSNKESKNQLEYNRLMLKKFNLDDKMKILMIERNNYYMKLRSIEKVLCTFAKSIDLTDPVIQKFMSILYDYGETEADKHKPTKQAERKQEIAAIEMSCNVKAKKTEKPAETYHKHTELPTKKKKTGEKTAIKKPKTTEKPIIMEKPKKMGQPKELPPKPKKRDAQMAIEKPEHIEKSKIIQKPKKLCLPKHLPPKPEKNDALMAIEKPENIEKSKIKEKPKKLCLPKDLLTKPEKNDALMPVEQPENIEKPLTMEKPKKMGPPKDLPPKPKKRDVQMAINKLENMEKSKIIAKPKKINQPTEPEAGMNSNVEILADKSCIEQNEELDNISESNNKVEIRGLDVIPEVEENEEFYEFDETYEHLAALKYESDNDDVFVMAGNECE